MATNEDGTEVLETPVEVAPETTQETPAEPESTPEISPEEIAGLREKAAKADDLEDKNKKLFERVKKAEARVPSKELGDLTNKDVLFLSKVDVHEEDLDTVLDWAKFKKISVADAHKEMKTVLDVRAEQRRTAEATNTKGSPRGTSKVSGIDLLAQAQRGEAVEPTDENFEAIQQARLARKTARYKKR